MKELSELLDSTKTGLWISHIPEYGLHVGFTHATMRYDFMISTTDMRSSKLSMEELILYKLEWFLEKIGVRPREDAKVTMPLMQL